MKTLQLFFFSFLPGGCLEPLLSPPLWLRALPLLHSSPGLRGGAGHPDTLGHCLGTGWGAGTSDYISHHAQHCGPHQTKKEVDSFTWIPGGPEGGRGRGRRLRRRLHEVPDQTWCLCVCFSVARSWFSLRLHFLKPALFEPVLAPSCVLRSVDFVSFEASCKKVGLQPLWFSAVSLT